jgi:Protein of unknown function (DUF3040)
MMWGRKRKSGAPAAAAAQPSPLTQAMHQARVEAAERTSVVVDLRDAEVARLELLNEALDPLFAEIPPEVELFDRGISRGDTPRLWFDAVAHVAMGRDKRVYRLLSDTRVGRRVLAESHEIADIVKAVTAYVARRLVDRQRALDEDPEFISRVGYSEAARAQRRRRWRAVGLVMLGFLLGLAGFIAAVLVFAAKT